MLRTKLSGFLLIFTLLTARGFTMEMEFDESINTYLKNNNFSGVVLVSHQKEVLHHQAYGTSNHEKNISNQLDTVFPIASVTKPLTATVVMQLVAEQKLSLTAKLSEFVTHPFPNDPTIADLLHHTSGLNLYADFSEHDVKRAIPLTDQDFYQRMTPLVPPEKQPMFQYNNGNYILLGQVIEVIRQQSYQDFFAKNIFSPLQMSQTCFVHQTQKGDDQAYGYLKTERGLCKAPSIDESWLGCGAGIASTAYDLYRFIQAYLDGKLIDETSRQEMLKGTVYHYSLGWTLDENSSAFYHEGGISGFSTMLFHNPEHNLTIIALSNVETDIEEVTRKIATLVIPTLKEEKRV